MIVMIVTTSTSTVLPVSAANASETCGDNLTWTLDDAGTLTISGTGAMTDWYSDLPWDSNQSNIKSVVIESGVTSIDDSTFYGCKKLASAAIPNTVTSIGSGVFRGCSGLRSLS